MKINMHAVVQGNDWIESIINIDNIAANVCIAVIINSISGLKCLTI